MHRTRFRATIAAMIAVSFWSSPVLAGGAGKAADKNASFFNLVKRVTRSKAFRQLSEMTNPISKAAAKAAAEAKKQPVFNYNLQTPMETAKFLGRAAFEGGNGLSSAMSTVVGMRVSPKALQAAAPQIPPKERKQVGQIVTNSNPQLARIGATLDSIYVPPPPGTGGPAATNSSNGENTSANGSKAQPNETPSQSATPGQAAASASSNPPPNGNTQAQLGNTQPQTQTAPQTAPVSSGGASYSSSEPAFSLMSSPPGYAPVSGGSMGCTAQ